jgi:anti-anti-sigma regulatory factor
MSDSRGKDSSFLRKVVKFVSNPNTEWGELEPSPAESTPAAQDRSELQVMIERKRRNDFVRRQELDLLRQIRREGLTADQIHEMQRQEGFESSGYQPTERGALPPAEVRRRIDGIEREMSYEDTVVNTRSLPLAPPPPARPPGSARRTTVGLHETTQQAANTDPTRPGVLRRLGSQVTVPKVDLDFYTLPNPAELPTPSRAASQAGSKTSEPEATSNWHPMLEVELAKSELAHDPDLDEAAMAFANADFGGCEKMLRSLVTAGGARQRHAPTWRALLDLYRAIGQQQRFDWTCAQFVKELGETPPAWVSIPRLAMNIEGRSVGGGASSAARSGGAASAAGGPTTGSGSGQADPWRCPVHLDAAAVGALRAHVNTAVGKPVIDWGPLQMLDAQGAQALRNLLREWASSTTPQQWQGVGALFDLLEIAAPPGDHLADPAFWQVRLEALRLLGVQASYDLAAEDFAATYGTTPPEWQPASTVVSTEDNHLDQLSSKGPDFAVSTLPDELGANTSVTVELAGQLAGDVSATMSQALSELGDAQTVTVACDRLIRVDLMAAGELLNWVAARRAEGRLVRFTQVHRLVALFFCAMGLDDQAPIELRSL